MGLHQAIRTVVIVTEEGGEWKEIEEGIKPGVRTLEESREQARLRLAIAPAVILGAADAIKGPAGRPVMVAILYEKVAAIMMSMEPLTRRIMCVTTEVDSLEEVMKAIRPRLPEISSG